MKKRILKVLLLLFVVSVGTAYSADFSMPLGSTGAQLLGIVPSARPAAMGNAFVAVTDDINGIAYNPASLAFLKDSSLSLTHNQWFDGVSCEYAAFGIPLQGIMTLAGSVFYLDSGNIVSRDNEGTELGTYKDTGMAATLCFSQKLSENLSVGANGRLLSQTLENESADCYQMDIGVLLRLSPGLNLGFALQNMGQDITFISESDPSPINLRAGFAFTAMNGLLVVAGDVSSISSETMIVNAGSEMRVNNFAMRAGYQMNPTQLSVGAGMDFGQGSLDYGWMLSGYLGNAHRFTLNFRF